MKEEVLNLKWESELFRLKEINEKKRLKILEKEK